MDKGINANPLAAGGRQGGVLDRKRGGDNATPRKLPPYGTRLDPQAVGSVAILTGSDAWTRARSPSGWMRGARLLLPFGDDPATYRWPVAGRDCVVYGFGDAEPRARLVALSVEIVRAGALFVIWAGQWQLTAVFDDGTTEARLDAGALSERPAPVFRPAGKVAA